MISLKEALVRKNRVADMRAVQKEAIAEKIKKDYNTNSFEILDDGNKFIVNIKATVTIHNDNIKKIIDVTDGLFEFGYIQYLTIYNCKNLTSLEGCPEKVDNIEVYRCPKLDNLKGISTQCYDYLLEYLNISNLEGLGNKCECLTLYGLPKLKTLKYLPKNIKKLRLYGLNELKDTSDMPKKLDELLIAWCPLKLSDFDVSYVYDLKGKYDPYGVKLYKEDFKGKYTKCNIFQEESPF